MSIYKSFGLTVKKYDATSGCTVKDNRFSRLLSHQKYKNINLVTN